MEAVKLNEVDKLRFRVHRDQGVVTFYGSIGDTPDTAALDGILLNGSVCDMRHVVFASWIGLAVLGDYIQKHQLKLTFRALPFSVYDSMRLNKAFEDQTFESSELPLIHTETQRVSYELIELGQLRKDAETGNEWVYPKPGHLLLIPSRYLFPDLIVQRSMGYLPVQVLTPQKEMASFWLQYGAFCQSTVAISSTLIHAARLNMLQIINEIKAKTTAGESALKLIQSKTNYTLVARLETVMQDIAREFDRLSEKVQTKFNECEVQLAHLSLLALNKGCEVKPFATSLRSYALNLDSLTQVASICEDCGASIGTKLTSVRPAEIIKEGLEAIDEPAPDTLNAIRAAFAIMDIMSEDDWPASRELVMAEIDAIDTLTGKCIVTLQVFDMMRQILEHRIREVNLVLAAYESQGPESLLDPDLREAVLNKIGTQLVTEQEKAAFAFYLPDGFQKFGQTERKEPGDVLLF